MSNIADTIYRMRSLDELSGSKSPIHAVHPLSKLLVTLGYLTAVVSFGKYDTGRLLPFALYPFVILAAADLPAVPMLKRMLPAFPFVIGIGIFNPLLDRTVYTEFLGLSVSGGWISFLSLMLKCAFTVLAALMLIATTGMERIGLALRMLRVPRIFVLQLLLTYRYITVLAEEARRIWNAYMLRAPGQRGISYKAWGPLAGQLLLRTFDRAQRVYQAMGLRGFRGEYRPGGIEKPGLKDILYFICWTAFFVTARCYNIPVLIGTAVSGVIR